jgi:hypothetical protein
MMAADLDIRQTLSTRASSDATAASMSVVYIWGPRFVVSLRWAILTES